MTIDDIKRKYFWLGANDPVTATEPEPTTFGGSLVTPLVDMAEYAAQLVAALATVGVHDDPAANADDFILVSNWWLALVGGRFVKPEGNDSSGGSIEGSKPFDLDPLAPTTLLIDVLKEKARRGVDVRVLGWVSYSMMSDPLLPFPPFLGQALKIYLGNYIRRKNPANIPSINAQTFKAVKELRAETALKNQAVLNIVGHPSGAVHIKMAVIGNSTDSVGFTGGLDFEQSRWAEPGHIRNTAWEGTKQPFWHDVQAMVQGDAVQGLYDAFQEVWNENLERPQMSFRFDGGKLPHYVNGTSGMPDRAITTTLPPASPIHHVQSLRTVPAFKFKWYNCLPEGKRFSYAPDGLFEVRAAWKKAISAAESYIYMEDQLFWAKEVFQWINAALKARPGLKLILAMSGAQDPNDPEIKDGPMLHESINLGLLDGLSTAQIEDQIRIYRVWGESVDSGELPFKLTTVTPAGPNRSRAVSDIRLDATTKIAANALVKLHLHLTTGTQGWDVVGNEAAAPDTLVTFILDNHGMAPPTDGTIVRSKGTFGVTMHSKITLIDDVWAIVGSANTMRRSLYTDVEHSVAFVDESGAAVKEFRKRLWAEHFNNPDLSAFDDLAAALRGWAETWGTATPFPTRPTRPIDDRGPPFLQRVALPLPERPMSSGKREQYDLAMDPDSRSEWGGISPPSQD
jgi:phosphatidylserine/phosphatidylglycerophosphate/cardiolipin synthase-like enzyme